MMPIDTPKHIYEKLFSQSLDMMCVANTAGYFQLVNPSFSEKLGYSEVELLSTAMIDFIHPNDIDKTLQVFALLSNGQHSLCFENSYRHKNNGYLTLAWTGHVDADSGLIYLMARDITQQVKVSNKLQHLQQALEQETIYAETDVNGVITKVNDKFCQISGYSAAELLGHTHQLVNSGYHSSLFFRELWQTISSGKIWSGAIKNRKKNGDYYFVQSILIPIFDNNEISSYVAIRQDITDKVNSDYYRLKALKILNETSAVAKVGGWELEISTGVLSWTDETLRILEVDELYGATPLLTQGLELFIDKDIPIIENAVHRAITYGEPYALELQASTPKGNIKWIYTNGKANYIDGKIVTLSGTIQDIHERKITEINYHKEKQKNIVNAKFAALGELSASIAHEINNPLGVISGYAELLQLTSTSASAADICNKSDIILKSCDRISHIVKSLKKYSRTDEERQYRVCSLQDLIQEAVVLTKPKLKQRMIRLQCHLIEDIQILCNEIEIEQVMVNLINNAIDAVLLLPDKWVDISMIETPTDYNVVVTDAGLGIPLDKQHVIFEPFFTSKKASEGTGLGLSIVKGILDSHDATISIDNNSINTRFTISFPKSV